MNFIVSYHHVVCIVKVISIKPSDFNNLGNTHSPCLLHTSAAVVTLTLGKTKTSVVTSVGAWPPTTAAVALPPLLTDEGLLQDVLAAAAAVTAALTKKFASSICKKIPKSPNLMQQAR